MYKLFSDLGVNGKLWLDLAIEDLYTDVKQGYYIQAHYLKNSKSHRVQGRGEY